MAAGECCQCSTHAHSGALHTGRRLHVNAVCGRSRRCRRAGAAHCEAVFVFRGECIAVQTHTPTSSETSSATSSHSVGASASGVSAASVRLVHVFATVHPGSIVSLDGKTARTFAGPDKGQISAIASVTRVSTAAASLVQTGTGSWTASSTQVRDCSFCVRGAKQRAAEEQLPRA
jgi:hypothetical protein